jgi:hypothetical protein
MGEALVRASSLSMPPQLTSITKKFELTVTCAQ